MADGQVPGSQVNLSPSWVDKVRPLAFFMGMGGNDSVLMPQRAPSSSSGSSTNDGILFEREPQTGDVMQTGDSQQVGSSIYNVWHTCSISICSKLRLQTSGSACPLETSFDHMACPKLLIAGSKYSWFTGHSSADET